MFTAGGSRLYITGKNRVLAFVWHWKVYYIWCSLLHRVEGRASSFWTMRNHIKIVQRKYTSVNAYWQTNCSNDINICTDSTLLVVALVIHTSSLCILCSADLQRCLQYCAVVYDLMHIVIHSNLWSSIQFVCKIYWMTNWMKIIQIRSNANNWSIYFWMNNENSNANARKIT